MKKLFFVLSLIAVTISLSSCGAEEECRPRGGYTQQVIEQQQTPVIAYHYQTEKR